jgi:glycosyltransferase involved in cell wall biosynthesis
MKRPLITIGITAFNAERTVLHALRSALEQKWDPIEIIVIDDASTDRTRSEVERAGSSHKNIIVMRNSTNGGVAVSVTA